MKNSKEKIDKIKKELFKISKKEISIMEVCGTHTMSLAHNAIRSLLPPNIDIISGPGCPVCVTPTGQIQLAIQLSKQDDFIITTFGDMLKVPGKKESLQDKKSVRIVYSPLESLKIARMNPDKNVVFLGIGFETTAPLVAATILEAHKNNISNFTVLPMNKTVPEALKAIISVPKNKIEGLILPGHVSAITGRKYFDFIKDYHVSGVIAGFEAQDIMECIFLLTKYINQETTEITNNYPRVVGEEGNLRAQEIMKSVFDICDSEWRGIGPIPLSGLSIKREYQDYDTIKRFSLKEEKLEDPPGCLCGSILMGKNRPNDCRHFGKSCTPSYPIGPCMVSSEGTCAAWYKYKV